MEEEEHIEGFGEVFEQEELISAPSVTYRLCNIKDAEQKMNEKIENVINFLFVQYDEALLLLQHFNWNDEKLQQKWTDDSKIATIRAQIGIPAKPNYQYVSDCPICCKAIPSKDASVALPCGHSACLSCASDSIVASIKYNEVVFSCWECKCKIPYSIISKILSPKDFSKFKVALIRSYTNESKTIRWCPNRGCEYYCDFPDMLTTDIRCYCGYIYCFGCNKESHKPAKCDNRKKWDDQNDNDDEKMLESFAKKCPKCGVFIDKNGGCFQMTCFKCHHQFCWMCLADWSTHSNHFSCLKFPSIKVDSVNEEQIKKAEEKLKSFYFERYIDQQRSKSTGERQLKEIKDFITLFCGKCKFHPSELIFLEDACSIIINSRRILANTYIEMFFCKNQKEKNLVEYLMERLQFMCDNIHKLIEVKKDGFLDDDDQHKEFFIYKDKVLKNTMALKDALRKFEEGVEAGYTNY